jgi:hypothetical protein
MATCPSGRGIPWHRVIGAGGRLLIREPHSSLQRRLLETEGVAVDGKRVDMKEYVWIPNARTKSNGPRQHVRKRRTSRQAKPHPQER